MKRALTILAFSILLSSLSAQTFYNDYFNATLDIEASTASFEVDGQQFKGEFLSKEMKSYPYSTVYCVGSEDGVKSLLFTTQFKLREGSDNNIKELYTVQLPAKKAIKSAMRNFGEDFSYSMRTDESIMTDYNTIKNNIDKLESEASRNKRLEREKEAAEKRKLFADETDLTEYIGVYQVKIGNYGGTNVSSLDFSAQLIVTEAGVSLIGDFLTYGKISGTFKKDKAILDFEEGTFECFISKGFGDEMIVRVNQEKTAGAISRMSGNRPYDTITFTVLRD